MSTKVYNKLVRDRIPEVILPVRAPFGTVKWYREARIER